MTTSTLVTCTRPWPEIYDNQPFEMGVHNSKQILSAHAPQYPITGVISYIIADGVRSLIRGLFWQMQKMSSADLLWGYQSLKKKKKKVSPRNIFPWRGLSQEGLHIYR